MLIVGARHLRPTPPAALSDEAQLFGRATGRRFGRMEWSEGLGCFTVRFGRKADDPVMEAWQNGELEEEPCEMLLLQEWDAEAKHYRPMDLEAMGPSGFREMLEQADLLSGQGVHNSLTDAVRAMQLHNAQVRAGIRQKVRENGLEMDWLHTRSLNQTPYITAGIDLRAKAES